MRLWVSPQRLSDRTVVTRIDRMLQHFRPAHIVFVPAERCRSPPDEVERVLAFLSSQVLRQGVDKWLQMTFTSFSSRVSVSITRLARTVGRSIQLK